MDHPETVVASLLDRIKEVTPLVPEGHIVEENILKDGTEVKDSQRLVSRPQDDLCS